MSSAATLDLASIPERVQSEVQRAIQRSIKGVEYFSTSGLALGSTPKDVLHTRGTMKLYHYRPLRSAQKAGEFLLKLGEPSKVLCGCREQDFVSDAAQAPQAEAVEPENALHGAQIASQPSCARGATVRRPLYWPRRGHITHIFVKVAGNFAHGCGRALRL